MVEYVSFWTPHPGTSLQDPPLPEIWRKLEKLDNWIKLEKLAKLEKMVKMGECKIPSVQKTTPFGRPTQAFHRLYQMTTMAVATVGFRVLGSS